MAALLVLSSAITSSACLAVNVTTHHYDTYRTGWNQAESVLTPYTIAKGSFGVTGKAKADAQIDAQPLVVQGLSIKDKGVHDVVFIATENDSIYALDASSGEQLVRVNLGPSVPASESPRHGEEGIQSTPVIDATTNTMYVITYTLENQAPTYRLHALDLATLTDKMPSVVVAAQSVLDDGTALSFDANVQRQRPALLESGGNIYAAFGSFGDAQDQIARGWLLGWSAANLTPLAANTLTNHRSSAVTCNRHLNRPCYLSSIWMSGSGVAADDAGYVYVLTGNSESGSWSATDNLEESALKMSADLSRVLDYFTPWDVDKLDSANRDFASGGITLLPDYALPDTYLAVAAGKTGIMYVIDRADMGQHVDQPPDRVPASYQIGKCWCAQSYFVGPDHVARVVTSGGAKVEIWKFGPLSKGISLSRESVSPALESGQDPGFFTSISSDGMAANTAIVWAVARPQTSHGWQYLYAFDASNAKQILDMKAGIWPATNHNANVVPVVANGHVYVAGGSHLVIFGLNADRRKDLVFTGSDPAVEPPMPGHEIYGTVMKIRGSSIALRTRKGVVVAVDGLGAMQEHNSVPLFIGQAIGVDGSYVHSGAVRASSIFGAKDSPALWPDDR
ncbi:MAG TPA: hypothetical protein VHY79_08880 [Rhizomicrobium sp.]|jgi:outer membrane protein assembly factor BamB|nr:hypothetical protein [Rhizomicrobium sp.]